MNKLLETFNLIVISYLISSDIGIQSEVEDIHFEKFFPDFDKINVQ